MGPLGDLTWNDSIIIIMGLKKIKIKQFNLINYIPNWTWTNITTPMYFSLKHAIYL